MKVKWLLSSTAVLLLWAGIARPAHGQFTLGTEFQAGDTIQTLTVGIDVGGDTDALQEPLALDLGLGFPFWLHPVGRQPDESVPFGAIPQEGDAGDAHSPGVHATYTFRLEGEPGMDQLLATPQLLAGARVSDITRIGFASQGLNNWVLAGYSLEINGRPFAANNAVNGRAQAALASAQTKLAEVDSQVAPLETERDELQSLVEAQLATPEDQTRLAEVQTQLDQLRHDRTWCEGQVQGRYPWFEESGFRSPWRQEASVKSVRVTLTTYTHTGAGTENVVYFRSGGKKYALSSPLAPLNASYGPQTFELDLLAGPLAAADLRGYALGMLANPFPYAEAPDRWHPQRLLVEVDGRVVYDSEEADMDRLSLEAIRLIPPAHLNEQGETVTNAPTARETCLWEAGKGQGVDLAQQQALPLPAADDPAFPAAEPLADEFAVDEALAEEALTDPDLWDVDVDADFWGGDFDPGFPLFPGEMPGGWGPPPGPVWPDWNPGWGQMPPWLDFVFNWLLPDADDLPPGEDPPPEGDPFQIESVRITEGWDVNGPLTIAWTTSGDAADFDHLLVQLLEVYPDRDFPFGAVILSESVPLGQTEYSGTLPAPAADCRFVAPVVTALPADPAASPHQRRGPAKAVFPVGSSVAQQPQLANSYICERPPAVIIPGAVSFGGEPAGLGRAVWAAGELATHNALLFDNSTPGWNVGARTEVDDTLHFHLQTSPISGRRRVLAHVGFIHGPGGGNDTQVEMRCGLVPIGPGAVHTYGPATVHVVNPVGGPPTPMPLVEQVIDTADTGAFSAHLYVSFTVRGGAVDAAHPPALVGVRMIPEP